jgi:nuclease HARBI1
MSSRRLSRIERKCMVCVYAFIDGTARRICRPTRDQDIAYSGHKKYHCLKYQSFVTPDGIIVHLFGPVEGARHDAFVLHLSCIASILQQPPFAQYLVYGDGGYSNTAYMTCPYRAPTAAAEIQFNKRMAQARVSVEWAYGRVTNLFRSLSFFHNQRLLQTPLAQQYKAAVLFTNIRTCLDRGNILSDYFRLTPPSLQQYLICDDNM